MAIDVTVRGAGIFGLSCAWALVERGATVRVVDPAGVGAGASGGVVGALAPHVPEPWNAKKQFQLDSLVLAESWWAEVAEAGGGDPGYGRIGRFQPLPDAEAVTRAEARTAAAEARWPLPFAWRVVPTEGDWPPSPTGLAVHDTLTARLHPARACTALAAALRVRGVEIVPDAVDEGLVLHATGWRGLSALREDRERAAGVGVKGQAAVLGLDRRDLPQLFVEGLHVVPHADGTVAIGSTSETSFDAPDATDALLDDVLARARAAVPALRDAPMLRRWAGVRPRTRSRGPLLGAWPGRAGHFVANGGFKIGFGIAPRVGAVMAALMLEGEDGVPEGFGTEGLARWEAPD